ncbi:MAG: hypothetical protein AAGA56_17455 [Myxococcota bacterium]
MRRREILLASAASPALLWSRRAWAGSYLNRAALLLDGARTDRAMAMPRGRDRELMRVVHEVAAARVTVATTMDVPKVVAGAHPHMLLTLENCERGYAAALERQLNKFSEHLLRAKAEDRIFRQLVESLGYTMPPTR